MHLVVRECPLVIDGVLELNGIAVVANGAEAFAVSTPRRRRGRW
jgi:hypothetical protein